MTNVRRHRLTLALLISLLLHLTLIGIPGWRVPTLDDLLRSNASSPLEAHLVVAPPAIAPVSRPIAAPSHPRHPPRQRAEKAPRVIGMSQGVDALPTVADPSPAVQQPAAEAPSVPVQEAPPDTAVPAIPPAPKLPSRGSIRFSVSKGEQGFIIGQSLHRWSHDGKVYTLNSITETTGIAAVFRPVRVVQTSEGEVGMDGLRPRVFRTEKDGVAGDSASFDWTEMKLVLTGGPQHEVRLMTGAQDMLSMFYQLSALFPWVPNEVSEIMIATGRKFERYAFKVLGEEKLPTKFGELRVLHLRTDGEGGEAIDIWACLDLQNLPVKIRYTDRQGETFNQNAEDIDYEGMPSTFKGH